MKLRKHITVRLLLLLGLLLALVAPGRAEVRFLPPGNDRPLFKRDLLPLETDTIRTLSRQLTTLLHHHAEDTSAARYRADAQLLVLALQLDPVNQQARRDLRRLARGEPARPGAQGERERSLRGLEEAVTWLLSPAAGSEGRLLGQLVIDPLRVLYPDHPLCRLAGPGGEAERWRGIVAPVTAFIRQQPQPAPIKPEAPAAEAPADSPSPGRFTLASASLRTPLKVQRRGRFGGLGYRLVTLQAKLLEETPGEKLVQMPEGDEDLNSALQDLLAAVLAHEGMAPPSGQAYAVSLDSGGYHGSNHLALSGPLALLLHASLSGASLRPDLSVLGSVSAQGRFGLPTHGWTALKTAFAAEEPQGRLLVPAEALPQMRDLLVLENNRFFVAHEVFAITTLDEALVVARADGEPGLAEASRLFADFQKVADGRQLGELSSNSHVRSRMEKILTLAPNHLSAQMVLLHGSPKRPLKFDPSTLALELQVCLDLLAKPLAFTELEEIRPGNLLSTKEQCLAHLRGLKKHTASAHLDLLGRFEVSANRIGRLARALEELRMIDPEEDGRLHTKALRDVLDHQEKLVAEHEALREATGLLGH